MNPLIYLYKSDKKMNNPFIFDVWCSFLRTPIDVPPQVGRQGSATIPTCSFQIM